MPSRLDDILPIVAAFAPLFSDRVWRHAHRRRPHPSPPRQNRGAVGRDDSDGQERGVSVYEVGEEEMWVIGLKRGDGQ